ncbi:hypothetical protein Q4F19_11455 [Sphingomonas sp. BIUV-7]|uniref:Uncharacterized protein n=1 Tax=Sphingomonas natans TaxID=3063330 RepID=A0ABT8Y9J3_9SPHN|nr:hypothetical protein [Sphingomonas sp. BIUV-7]MDO6414998.1 hypothetical protein [Sphingomonas sp. BIUV-7]
MSGVRAHAIPTCLAVAILLVATPSVRAQNVNISNLSDVDFGALPTTGVDQTKTQSVCAYSGLLGGKYSVTATGSGAGGAFTLANGGATLAYEVQWAGSSGQTSGTNLTAGSALPGQTMLLSCPVIGATDASLILVIRGTAIVAARAGNYNGTLTIILAAN